MKRIFAALLFVMLLISLAACKKAAPEATPGFTTAPIPVETVSGTIDSELDYSDFQQPLAAVSMPIVSEQTYADDGTLLFTYNYQNVFPILQDSAVANSVSIDLLNRIDASQSEAASIRASALEQYSGGAWAPYSCSTYYNTMRIDQGVLSLFGGTTSYQGGAHASTVGHSVTYSLVSGKALSLSDILSTDATPEQLSQAIIDVLSENAASLYPDYDAIISERFGTNSSLTDSAYLQDWYFSNSGLCFFFSPYDIAPYFVGTVTAEIPYAELTGLLMDDYFPAETIPYEGSITAQLFHPDKLENFTQLAEAVLDRNGQSLILSTDTYIRDIRIDAGQVFGSEFIPTATVFAAECITLRDAIMLQESIPVDTPTIRVCYNDGQQIRQEYIIINAADGNVSLQNDIS